LYFTVIMIIFAAFFRTGVRPPVYAEADPSTDASHQTGVRPHVETKTLDELEKYKDCRDMFIGATETLWQLAEEAKAEGFRTILLSQANGTKENVGCLQKYLFEVWVEEAGPQHALEPYYSILSGADGIITDRPETIQSALNEILSWTKDSTILLRSPLIIGYGGLPSVAPMDSLEGLNMAIARHMPATEVGVFFTKDGVPIVAHRDNLLELTGQDVNISDLTENEVTSYRIIAGNTTAHQQCLVTRFKDFLSAIRGTDHILYVSLSTDEEQLISFCYELVSDLDVESQVIFISPGDSFSTIFTGQGSDPLPNSLPEKAESPQSKLREGEQLIFTKNAIDFTDFLCELTPKDTELSINTKAMLSTQAQATLRTVSGNVVPGKISIQILKGNDCLKLSEDGTALSGVKYGTAVILYKYTDTIPGTGEAYTLYSQPFTVSINSDIGERIMFFTGIAVGVIGLVIIIIIIVKRPRAPKFKPVPMSKD
jgi:glycerophosphoryl diester phosphodiesterase